MKTYKYTWLTAILFVLMAFAQSCEQMLETPPEDSQTKEEFWKVKGDVEATMIGAYDALQGCIWKCFIWGEIRGELLEVERQSSFADLKNMNNLDINQDNSLCGWGELYSAINRFNTIINFAPEAAANDNTFSGTELNEYLGEAYTLRALLNFYLARTFQEFPYITFPFDNDELEFNVMPSAADEAMDLIIEDLLMAKDMVKENYSEGYFKEKEINIESLKLAYRKGRVSKPVVWAILTDVYLTKGDYENAVLYADSIIDLPGMALETRANWHKMFEIGNSESESIFELQYSRVYREDSDIAKWFVPGLSDGNTLFFNTINVNTGTLKYWEGDDRSNVLINDKRGVDNQFLSTNKLLVWKWAGLDLDNQRDRNSSDANWIFYRLPDIILMKAEAQNRLGNVAGAITTLDIVRKRSIASAPKITETNMLAIEELILDERARELAAEGKRWFDLVRIAKRQNNYEIIGNRIADFRAYPNNQVVWKGKVYDPASWYLPIQKNELALNRNLKQNPYYEDR